MPSVPELSSSTPDPTSPGCLDSMEMDTTQPYGADTGLPESMNEDGSYDQMEMMELDSQGDVDEPPERDPPVDVNAWRGFLEDPSEPDDSLDVIVEVYPGAGMVQKQTTMTGFSHVRQVQELKGANNIFYPFSGETEWELVSWLHHAGVSMSDIDKFLKLRYVHKQPLSFQSGETMRDRIETLPDAGPRWKELAVSPDYGTPLDPVTLLYRDPLEAIADLLARPAFADAMQFSPRKIWKDVGKTKRVYSEMSTGNWWWRTQATLPEGSTVIPILLGSDQVHLSVLSGDKKAWPVYLSIGNIVSRVRNKPSNGAWMIIAYLPVPDFGEHAGILKLRLFHQCMEILLTPLIEPGTKGVEMTDSTGAVRKCYPFVAAYLADHPEQALINCCMQNVCPTTTANFRQMGDPTPAAPRTREWILARIEEACAAKDPSLIGPYYKKAGSLGISAVHKPFWRNLPNYQPELVLAPDLLHGAGMFWRHHLFLWIQRLVGTDILDQRLMALQHVTGFKSFHKGISHLTQWTGREDRELQRVTVALAAGTVQMTPKILRNIRAFHDFLYLAQYRSHSTTTLRYLTDALAIFHETKHVWIDEEVRYGEKPELVMNHFNIPKLAMLHAYGTHIPEMGASPQFSTDITEYNHQFMAKTAYKATNRKEFALQMCRFLDRSDRLARQAELIAWCRQQEEEAKLELLLSRYNHDIQLKEKIRADLKAKALAAEETSYTSHMKRSRLWLTNKPSVVGVSLATISVQYCLPNLLAATNEFLSEYAGVPAMTAGLERAHPNNAIDVWKKIRVRLPDVLEDGVFSVHTVDARPPMVNEKVNEPYGNCHCVLVHDSADAGAVEIKGYRVAQVRLLFRLYLDSSQPAHLLPLAYVEYFSKPAAVPEDDIFMYRVSRPSIRTEIEASVISVASIARFIQLIPVFGPNPVDDKELNANTSMAIVRDYYVNSFADKQIYQSVY